MKLAELIKTPWAKDVRKESCDRTYLMSLYHAMDCSVNVIRQTAFPDAGKWSIKVIGTDWWLGCTKTKPQALALCKQMGWSVEK